jgi:hypothetical protein
MPEPEDTQQQETTAPSAGRSRPPRRWLVVTLVVVASVLGFLAINALWINRQALSTENWATTSSDLLESEPVRDLVAAFLVDEMYSSLDVEGELREGLPPRLKPLAGPAAGGLRTLADRGMDELLQRPRVQALWEEANRRAHRRLLQVLEGGGGNGASTEGGSVTLDLGTVLTNTAGALGIGGNIAAKLPEDAAEITILRSDQLEAAQDGLDAFRGLTIVLLVLSLGLYAAAVAVAGRRREALRAVGIGLVAAGAVALIARGFAGDELANALAKTASVKPAVADVWTISTSQLVVAAGSSIAYGVVIFVAAWLAGTTWAAVSTRRALAPYLRDARYAYGGLALLVILLIAWGPTPATRKPLSLLLLVGLLVLGVELLRRQTAREFPEATIEHAAQARHERIARWRDAVVARRQHVEDRATSPAESGASTGPAGSDRLERLERLARLRESGVIDQAEFEREKGLILAREGLPAPSG